MHTTSCPDLLADLTPDQLAPGGWSGLADELHDRLLSIVADLRLTLDDDVLMADAWAYLSESSQSFLVRYESGDLDGI